MLLLYAHCYIHELSLYTHTHTLTRLLSDDPGFARPDIERFVSVVQVFDEIVRFARIWTLFLLIPVFFPFFIPIIICDSCISHLASISFLYLRSWVAFICIIAVIVDYYGSDLQLVQVILWLACIRGVFLAYIRRRPSSRLRFLVF